MRGVGTILAALLAGGVAGAAELPLPQGAVLTAEETSPFAAARLPWGPWDDGVLPTIDVEGAVTRRAWRVPEGSLTPVQLVAPLRAAVLADGYAELYACADRDCGGYDFRFALDLIPAPAMHVDLGDYRYLLAARETGAGRRLVAVVASRGLGAGYLHVTEVETLPEGAAAAAVPEPVTPVAVPPQADPPPEVDGDLSDRLLAQGHAVLEALEFPSGSASLPGDQYPSLRALAAFLEANPGARIALVGHTDAVGAPEANLRLSNARAQAVRTRLIGAYGADPDRIDAEGAGHLAPVASNLTEEGRAANRRVEAILLAP